MNNIVMVLMEENYQKAKDKCDIKRSFGFIREYKNKSEVDVRAGDGIVSYGQRTIAKDGSFRLAGARWSCEELKPFAGFVLGAVVGDYWLSYVDVWYPSYPHGKFIIRLSISKEVG